MSDDAWVVVRQVAYPHEAHLMRSILAGHGIEAIVPEPHLLNVQPAYSLAIGGVRVFVKAADRDEAIRLLQDFVTASTIGAPGP
jgi:Putative prokaryotic signal transducing protein